ncbi:MAG: hypothetical protein ACAH95_04775 [Fimbriimonas sp.]
MAKNVLGGPSLIFLAAAIVFFAIGNFALGGLGLTLWVALLVLKTMRETASRASADPREEMDAESRSLFSPIRRLTNEIEEVVERNSDSTVMKVVGKEALDEATRIHDQVAKALGVRDDLKRSLRERNMSRAEGDKLLAKAEVEQDPTVKATLLSAVEARKMELSHYAVVEETIAKIDSSVAQAEAALSEMKARLSTKASGEKAMSATDDAELRDTISRMKTLSISYDEAEQLIAGDTP